MDAKKCDKCGEMYVPEKFIGHIGESMLYDHFETLYFYNVGEYSPRVDLCPKCSESLDNWFNDKN